ncbi:MAG: transglutaminase-like cysteine peptidase [Bauldia sp.]|nr:transglutaminase-like cysteine peptidase [Bauldia sp.]
MTIAVAAAVLAGPAVAPAHAAIDNVLQVDVLPTSMSALWRWREVLARHQAQTDSDGWTGLVAAISAAGPDDLLREVNRLVNRVTYVADTVDHWSTPTDFLRTGGDCEDYAIAKYLLLRQFGIPDSAMRIVVMLPPNAPPHAVLLVETANGPVALDNLRNNPYAFGRQATSTIVYAFNEQSMLLPTDSLRFAAR